MLSFSTSNLDLISFKMSKGQILKAVRSKTAVVLGAKEFFVMADEESLHGARMVCGVREPEGSPQWPPTWIESGERRHQLQKLQGQYPQTRFPSESKNVRAL